jgi:hypothetical protein
VLADGGVGHAPAGGLPQVVGRGMQLQYAPGAASVMAGALLELLSMRQVTCVRRSELEEVLIPVMVCETTQDWTTKTRGRTKMARMTSMRRVRRGH